jgi:hypothetical protein
MADDNDLGGIFIGVGGGQPQIVNLKRANRHGLIAGATGTGKTVTLQGIVEGFSANGVPCRAWQWPDRHKRRCTRSLPRAPPKSG